MPAIAIPRLEFFFTIPIMPKTKPAMEVSMAKGKKQHENTNERIPSTSDVTENVEEGLAAGGG